MRSRRVALAITVIAAIALPTPAMSARVTVWEGASAGPHTTSPNATVRLLMRPSVDAHHLRIRVTNRFGTAPLHIRNAWLGVPAGGGVARITTGTNRKVHFGGRGAVVIAAGAQRWSDPVAVDATAGGQVAVSVYAPGSPISSKVFPPFDSLPPAMFVGAPGDHAADESTRAFPASPVFTDGVEGTQVGYHAGQMWWVDAISGTADAAGTLVTMGDSLTEGYTGFGPPGQRWTDVLADRLVAQPPTTRLSVANAGISGNTIEVQPNPYDPTGACCGPPGVLRFRRDVLSMPGLRAIILLEGSNDIGGGVNAPPMPAANPIRALRRVLRAARAQHIPVIGATLLPMGFVPGDPREAQRQAVNRWIRTGGNVYAGVIDFDRMMRDPAAPWRILPAWASNDYHPNAVGHGVMGSGIDLTLINRVAARG